MKIKKIHIIIMLALFVSAYPLTFISAKEGEGDLGDKQQLNEKDQRNNDTADIKELNDENKLDDENFDNGDVSDMSDRHEKMMGGIISDLNQIGESEDNQGIGREISDIAKDEASSTDMRVQVMQTIEQRDFVSKFLVGVDKDKLKILSEELKDTQKNIDRLEKVKKSVASTTLQIKLDEQINSLQDAQAKADAFIKENENSFSLFGWFRNLFK